MLVADTDDPELVPVLDPGDEAHDLGRADIDDGDKTAARPVAYAPCAVHDHGARPY
jgi:hypothetical protein